MKKNFVLDTNVLIHNPDCLLKFEENDLFIPNTVIEELDNFKTERSERGYSARTALRKIKEYREKGNLIRGVPLPDGGTLFLLTKISDTHILPLGWDKNKKDNIILLQSLALRELDENTILITNDTNMMLKADALGLPVQEYRNDRVNTNQEIYTGRSTRIVDDGVISRFYENGKSNIASDDSLTENEFVILSNGAQASALCQYQNGNLVPLYHLSEYPTPFGVAPRNAAQRFLMDALLSPATEHPLTIVNGPAGTGKTLLTLACGLELVTEAKQYQQVLICRANVTMDEEIGFLPGSERDKIDPLLRGCYDNLMQLLGKEEDTPEQRKDKVQDLFDHGYIVAESIAYLRGRSICNTFIIVDEAQNCTPNQILSIVTRAGEGSKIVLLGDIKQIDSPRLDYGNNGLVYAIEKMKGSPLCEICSFDESESIRSALAKIAAERMGRQS